MALEIIKSPPALDHFALLSHHQEQTPNTFFGGKPVLHLHCPGAKIKFSKSDLQLQPSLSELGEILDADTANEEGDVAVEGVDVWVSSRHLTLFSPPKSSGVQISYPAIVVHAQDNDAVLLGLNLSDANTADEDLTFIQLRILPLSITSLDDPTEQIHTNGNSSPVHALFKSISDCQELNPDPADDDDDEDAEPDLTAPGATGWITSENMQDFVDENGEFRVPFVSDEGGEVETEGLGEGAGRTRTAGEVDDADADGEDGVVGETKWQRTG